MKTAILSLTALAAACWLGSLAAGAHESAVTHVHPHASMLDGALMGYETLALVALACAAATGITLLLARIRRRK